MRRTCGLWLLRPGPRCVRPELVQQLAGGLRLGSGLQHVLALHGQLRLQLPVLLAAFVQRSLQPLRQRLRLADLATQLGAFFGVLDGQVAQPALGVGQLPTHGLQRLVRPVACCSFLFDL